MDYNINPLSQNRDMSLRIKVNQYKREREREREREKEREREREREKQEEIFSLHFERDERDESLMSFLNFAFDLNLRLAG